MDKTLEIIIAATVILLTAALVMFMVSGQSGDFQNWLNGTQGDAECSLKKTQYENECSCDVSGAQPDAEQIRSEAQAKECGWPDRFSDCDDLC